MRLPLHAAAAVSEALLSKTYSQPNSYGTLSTVNQPVYMYVCMYECTVYEKGKCVELTVIWSCTVTVYIHRIHTYIHTYILTLICFRMPICRDKKPKFIHTHTHIYTPTFFFQWFLSEIALNTFKLMSFTFIAVILAALAESSRNFCNSLVSL